MSILSEVPQVWASHRRDIRKSERETREASNPAHQAGNKATSSFTRMVEIQAMWLFIIANHDVQMRALQNTCFTDLMDPYHRSKRVTISNWHRGSIRQGRNPPCLRSSHSGDWEQEIRGMKQGLRRLEQELRILEQDIRGMEQGLGRLEQELGRLEQEIMRFRKRVENFEKMMINILEFRLAWEQITRWGRQFLQKALTTACFIMLISVSIKSMMAWRGRAPKGISVAMPWTIPVALMVLWGVFWRFTQLADNFSEYLFDFDSWNPEVDYNYEVAPQDQASSSAVPHIPDLTRPTALSEEAQLLSSSAQYVLDFDWNVPQDYGIIESIWSDQPIITDPFIEDLAKGDSERSPLAGTSVSNGQMSLEQLASDHVVGCGVQTRSSATGEMEMSLTRAAIHAPRDVGFEENSSASTTKKRKRDESTLSCEKCPGQHFAGKRELGRHTMEKHERTVLFRCPQLGCKRHEEGFDRKSNRDRHVRNQHKNLDVDPHEALLDSPTPDRQRNRAAHLVEPPITELTGGRNPDSAHDEERKRRRVEEELALLRVENRRLLEEQEHTMVILQEKDRELSELRCRG
ncbi:hypothetical protein AK830_g10572 [Neonectria ditissima]|uniref:C2H2-type domain-containing protein n=1 Tax=Neonectria ditissima TaxID=78410 RepID=A0A0P7AFF1_9HYPO|nr:hypothetical protein AK830_g10572 [Neonectria ditissima]